MTSTGRSGGRRPPSCWPTCCWPPTWPTAPCWMPTAGSTTSPTTLRYGSCGRPATPRPRTRWPAPRGCTRRPTARSISPPGPAVRRCGTTTSLRDNDIARWVVPQPGLPEFTPERFVAGAQTLYLLSKNVGGGTSAAALVAALTTEVRVAAERAGERRGGRVDPAGAAGAGRGGQHLPDR